MKKIYLLLFITVLIISCNNDHKEKTKKSETKTAPEFVDKKADVPSFDGESAYNYVKKQVDFGPRVVNSEAHKKCGDFLIETFSNFADTVYVQKAKVRAYNQSILNIRNIIASFNPDKEKRILLGAHWDSRPYADYDKNEENHWKPIDGANDGASGVGVLLEVGRVLKDHPVDVGVDIILFDAEDYGAPHFVQTTQENDWGLGSQHWSRNPHIYGYSAHYGILLDMVGATNARFPKESFSIYYAPNVVDKVWKIAKKLGYGDRFVDEQGTTIMDDHYYVNTMTDIPMIDIIHLDENSDNSTFFDHWHTKGDNIDVIDQSSLKIVGDVLLNVLYRE